MPTIRVRTSTGPAAEVELRAGGSPTITELLRSLPFTSKAQVWGDEVYFSAPFHSELEKDARAEMKVGEVAFWPDGDALALFFGPTPISDGREPRAVSPCNVVGSILGDPLILRSVRAGAMVTVESV